MNMHDIELVHYNNRDTNVYRMRVPGGWVYTYIQEFNTYQNSNETHFATSSCFVPFYNENEMPESLKVALSQSTTPLNTEEKPANRVKG